jgi:hypothetical protein
MSTTVVADAVIVGNALRIMSRVFVLVAPSKSGSVVRRNFTLDEDAIGCTPLGGVVA